MKKKVFIMAAFYVMGMFFTGSASAGVEDQLIKFSDFLKSVNHDIRLENHRELIRYVEGTSKNTPYLDKVEVRTETEEFDFEKQKYALRFYPKGFGETRHLKKLSSLVSGAAHAENETYYLSSLKDRYDVILSYSCLQSMVTLNQDLLVLYEDKINVLREKCSTDVSLNINNLIQAEDQHAEIELDKIKYEHQMAGLLHQIRTLSGKGYAAGFYKEPMIPVGQISVLLPDLRKVNFSDNVYLKNRAFKRELAQTKYNVELAKNRDYISYFQVAWKSEDRDEIEKALSLEVAVKLPFVNSDKEDLERKKIKLLEDKLKYEEEKDRYMEKISSASLLLQRLISQRIVLSQRKEDGDAKVSYREYLKMDGVDPLDLLKIKESIIKNDMDLVEIDYRIRSAYLELLEISGRLSKKPLKNYLSPYWENVE